MKIHPANITVKKVEKAKKAKKSFHLINYPKKNKFAGIIYMEPVNLEVNVIINIQISVLIEN